MNAPFDKFISQNIRGTHWQTGTGPFGSPSTTNKTQFANFPNAARGSLPLERIKFMKESHFEPGPSKTTFASQSLSNFALKAPDLTNKTPKYDPANNHAYSLRHRSPALGDTKKNPNGFVTNSQIKIRWIQPQTVN
jgi:hypothetical protein